MDKTTFITYTDGGARGNPGPAGLGAVVMDSGGSVLAEVSIYLGPQTNNYAEYEAIVEALLAVKKVADGKDLKDCCVVMRMDSELAVRQLSGIYRVKNPGIKIQYDRVKKIAECFGKVTFHHIKREQNKHADRLANLAMDRASN